jgi:multidrug efflux pump subunit AcrB
VRNRVARLLLSGPTAETELHRLAHRVREDLLARDVISSVDVENLPDREMTVAVERPDLYRYGLTFGEIASSARRGVDRIAGGLLRSDRGEFLLEAGRRPATAGEFGQVPIRRGERGDIVFIHFRDVVGTVPQFNEAFVDEGNFDTVAAVRTLHDVGFEGAVIPDHVPEMVGDDDWRHRGRGFTVGYLRGVIDAVASD